MSKKHGIWGQQTHPASLAHATAAPWPCRVVQGGVIVTQDRQHHWPWSSFSKIKRGVAPALGLDPPHGLVRTDLRGSE
jgi:hypothetical protein